MTAQEKNQEIVNYIYAVLKEQIEKKVKTFYTIRSFRYGKYMPIVKREPVTEDNIKKDIEKYASSSDFKPDALTIELFSGKSLKIKKPFATFRLKYTAVR